MNRHKIPPQSNTSYSNGHNETPLEVSGVSLHRPPSTPQPTTFSPDLPLRGSGPLFYGLHRFQLGSMPASRAIALLWLGLAAFAAVTQLPGRWLIVGIALLLWAGHILLGLHWRRQNYSKFTPLPVPTLSDAPLQPSEKLPIYASGLFNVEGRYQRYVALPGFYRTFATGEHAILCRVQERNWLGLLSWPLDETGMWYCFVNPADIRQLTWGAWRFGATTFPALAVEYRLEIPSGPRRKQPEVRHEILYLAAYEEQVAQRLYIDLLNNLPQDRVLATPSTVI